MVDPPFRRRILAIEPYCDGSHRYFLDRWRAASRHAIRVVSMKGYKWKWRMRGAAIWLAEQFAERAVDVDCLVVSDFCNLCDLKALEPPAWRALPTVAYFHENQLTYPVPDEADRDYGYGFINLTTGLAADEVWFNSDFHRQEFLAAADALLGRLPDYVPERAVETVRAKSRVMPLGIDWKELSAVDRRGDGPPLVLWNHRWEYDKAPERFFDAVEALAAEGLPFRVAVAGQRYRTAPPVFDAVPDRLGDRLVQFGYLPSRDAYVNLLQQADVVVSTADHEFFGLSVLEAIAAGCFPVLPNRLSYPELLPADWHAYCLYASDDVLIHHLRDALSAPRVLNATQLSRGVEPYGWEGAAKRLDDGIDRVCRQASNTP